MKKLAIMGLTLALGSSLLAGCGSKSDDKPAATTGADTPKPSAAATEAPKDIKKVTLKMFQFKVEIADQLNKLKAEYEKANPNVTLQIETVGGGADYGAALKAKFASDDAPDIFNNGGFSDLELWKDKLEDLSDQPWVANVNDIAKEPMTKDGKIYGQPMNLEGYGFIYNKDLYAKAGITELPKTLTQLEDVAKKLQAAGITPFANGYQESWILGIHNLNVAFANQKDPDKFIAGLKAGSDRIPGNSTFDQWAKMFDLTIKYGNKNMLTTDYNTEITMFASGKAAMTQQGNWTQVQISKIDPNLKIGFIPMPINDEADQDKLFVGVPNNWVINKNSKIKPEAKEFLNWLVSSDIGKKYIVDEFKFIPAFKNITADAKQLGDLAADIQKYSQAGNVRSWNWFKLPDGAVQEFGSTMQAYIGGKKNKDQMLEDFQKTLDKMYKK
ncbi:ABC transporter substrate-binding protein [Paenibacillus sp. N1-5-1-14]|uniref:ABC transporter substrate-binding protein n=1 Tax=Paenibacillus radicibacter TaxID=2972488 RepID=UPI002159B400|nr:ABC transporter substrate-binding protein [Paenibacillus radicibacter]MCR8645124.1 ABC transporter substrate-binding protein [Paenibacillus radicibacter]